MAERGIQTKELSGFLRLEGSGVGSDHVRQGVEDRKDEYPPVCGLIVRFFAEDGNRGDGKLTG